MKSHGAGYIAVGSHVFDAAVVVDYNIVVEQQSEDDANGDANN